MADVPAVGEGGTVPDPGLVEVERYIRLMATSSLHRTPPVFLRVLLAEYHRRGAALEHAEQKGIGEWRVTQWAYDQAVRVMHEAQAELAAIAATRTTTPGGDADGT